MAEPEKTQILSQEEEDEFFKEVSEDEFGEYNTAMEGSDSLEKEIKELEDFETTMNKIKTFEKKKKEEVELKNLEKQESQIPKPKLSKKPEVIEDFIRNYFQKNNFAQSLQVFQEEFYEKSKRGQVTQNVIPDVYIQNRELEDQVIQLQKGLEEAQQITRKALAARNEALKQRNYHKLHHQRVVVEKEMVIKDLKKLKEHVKKYDPIIATLKKKYEDVMKEKMLVQLARDKLQAKLQALELSNPNELPISIGQTDSKHQAAQAEKTNSKDKKKVEDAKTKKILSVLPPNDRENIFTQLKVINNVPKLANYKISKKLEGHGGGVAEISLHPKKPIVASASDDKTWKMWSFAPEIIMTGTGHSSWVSGVDFHPFGINVVTSSDDTTVKVWNFRKGCCSHTFKDHSQTVWGVNYHDTGDFVVSCSNDATAKIFDLNALCVVNTLRGHIGSVNSAVFKPFSNMIVTSSTDKTISTWDLRTSSAICAQTFMGHQTSCNYATFNYQGTSIASSDADGNVFIWDSRMNKEQGKPIEAGPFSANKIKFDPRFLTYNCVVLLKKSGAHLVVPSSDGSIKLFSTQSEDFAKVGELKGHDDEVNSVVFDKDNNFMVSCSSDKVVCIWDGK